MSHPASRDCNGPEEAGAGPASSDLRCSVVRCRPPTPSWNETLEFSFFLEDRQRSIHLLPVAFDDKRPGVRRLLLLTGLERDLEPAVGVRETVFARRLHAQDPAHARQGTGVRVPWALQETGSVDTAGQVARGAGE